MQDNPNEQVMTNVPSDERVFPNDAKAYNSVDRNAWVFGWNPQQELWNGRLAMLGFVAYLLWDTAGYSVLRNVLHLIR